MAPAKKIAKACNALRPYGISERRVKDALEELLMLYENHWQLIEDDNYRVVLDFVLEKKEEDKKADPKKKEASSSRGVKRVQRKLQLIDESDDDEEFEPSRKMVCLNGKDLASISEDSSNQLVEETMSGRAQQDDAQLIKTQQRPVSHTEHLVLKRREPDSPQTCSMQGKTDASSSFLGSKRAKPNCERGTGIARTIELEIEHCSDCIDTANVPGRNGSDNQDMAKTRAEVVGFNQPGDEAPLTVITPAEASQSHESTQNCFDTIAGDLFIHKSKPSYMEDCDNPVSEKLN